MIKTLIADNRWVIRFTVVAMLAFLVLIILIIYPAYQKSNNGMYASKLGYPEMLRRAGKPLKVQVAKPEKREITRQVMGEGVCSSKPVLVPIIPMALLTKIYVEEGNRVKKGDLLAELDAVKAEIKLQSAQLAASTAAAELERVRLGSAYVLAQERPEVEKINLASVQAQHEFAKEQLERNLRAYQKGVISQVVLSAAKEKFSMASEQLARAELSMTMAENGVLESLKIAENAVGDAQQAVEHRTEELKDYDVYSPVSGVIDRVLINAGEYNQDSGKPGFLISEGLWFDAYFDQSDFAYVKEGQLAMISLESYPGQEWEAKVAIVKPIVSFNSGGPETSRPLRPRGSGSPEWAATFKVKLEFTDAKITENVVTGMTGFARWKIKNQSMTVPRSAVLSISSGTALVYVITEEKSNKWEVRQVNVGYVGTDYVEILKGLGMNEEVMIDGHWTLKADDKIEIHSP
ncbi:MAG: HlyD family secretion protein [Akkermansiaceae bacterium]